MVIGALGPSRAVSAAGQSTCAVDLAGAVRCWGKGADGQLGNGAFADSVSPVPAAVNGATAISVGGFGACVVGTGASVSCWGSHDAGDGAFSTGNLPKTSSVSGVTRLATNFFHTCAIANNDVACWGNDLEGQLGRGDRSAIVTLQSVPISEKVNQIVVGTMHVCALGESGQIHCWGKNDYAEGTDAQLRVTYTPTIINPNLSGVTRLIGAYDHTCALNGAALTATCWGKAYGGALGTGVQARHVAAPAAVQTASIKQLALGYEHMCTLDTEAAVRCYGANSSGQLGDASSSPSPSGILPALASGATEVAAGEYFSCATVTTGIQCWGSNTRGQLGDGTRATRSGPVFVTTSMGFDQLGAGRESACARQILTGDVYCWGANSNGELGIGTSSDEEVTPQRVLLPNNPANVTDLWVGYAGACAKVPNGTVYCWGNSDEGQAGTGSESAALTPTVIPSVVGAKSVGLGTHGICFVTAGQVTCAGERRMLGTNDNSRSLPARPGLPDCN
jgi:alpha-tubulin suppressor-like RCC1 family protein